MEYRKNDWNFSNGVAKEFDDHVRQSVPFYDIFQDAISDMSCFFSQKNSKIIDIGTSTGNLIYELEKSNKHRNIDFIGIDIEEEMIKECKTRYNDITFYNINALDFDYRESSIVTIMLTLQFMSLEEREMLLEKIHHQLNSGGAIFIVEKIRTDIPIIHDMYNDLYYDFKMNNFTCDEIIAKNQSLRGIMNPLTVGENIKMFKKVGFEKIDIFMKINNFIGFVIIK